MPQLAFIIFCFLLSLGNRPAGARWAYALSMFAFALITVYMTAAAIYLAVRSIIDAEKQADSAAELLKSKVFVSIVISLCATLGTWLVLTCCRRD